MTDNAFLSTREPVRFFPADQLKKPEKERVVYLLRAPTVYDLAEFGPALTAMGAQHHGKDELMAMVRAGIDVLLDAPAEETKKAEAHAILDQYEAAMDAAAEETDAAERDKKGPPDDLLAKVTALENIVAGGFEPMRTMQASTELWLRLAPIEAFRRFCIGWENLDVEAARDSSGLTRATVEAVPMAHVLECGYRARDMMGTGGLSGN